MGSALQVESFVQDALSKVLSHLLCIDIINVWGFSTEGFQLLLCIFLRLFILCLLEGSKSPTWWQKAQPRKDIL